MSGVRIDVGAVWTAADQFAVNYGGAGEVTLTIRTSGPGAVTKALHATDVRQHIHEQLQTVNAALSCTESDGVYTISSSGSTFTTALNASSLQNFTKLPATSTAATSTTSGIRSPGVFISERPAMVTSGTRWITTATNVHRGRGRAIKILKRKFWIVDLQIPQSEISAWRTLARYMLQGQPFSIFQDTDEMGTAWGYTAPTKNIKGAMLDQGVSGFDEAQLTSPYQSELAVSFSCVEYA